MRRRNVLACLASAATASILGPAPSASAVVGPASASSSKPLTSPGPPSACRASVQTVQLFEPFLHCERRGPAAREAITVGGDAVEIGPWFAKARTKAARL